MTSFKLTEQGFALHEISQIFRKAYGAAKSVDGAYERVQEKILDMRRGIKTRRRILFISTEAAIHVTSIYRKIPWEKAKQRHDNKSGAERRKTWQEINELKHLWDEARKFDQTDHGGQQFVAVNQAGTVIVFSFIDGRSLIFDLTEMMGFQGFHKLYTALVAEWREKLIKRTEDESIIEMARNEIEMARMVSDRISETTLWGKRLVSQAVDQRSSTDKSLLYTHLLLLPGGLRKATKIINKAHNKVSAQDVSRAIQIVIVDLEEQLAE